MTAQNADLLAKIAIADGALFMILANTEEGAIKHIAHDGLTAYEALAKDIAECAAAALSAIRGVAP